MRLFRQTPRGRCGKQIAETYSGTDHAIDTYPLPDYQIGVSLGTGKDGRYFAALGLAEAEWLRDRLNDNINYQRSKQQ
jgi:hypothetical protein